MHKSGKKRNLDVNIDGLFWQETDTSTETSQASMSQFSHAPYWPGCGRLGGIPSKENDGVQVKVGVLNLA